METAEIDVDKQSLSSLPITRIALKAGYKGLVAATVNALYHQLVIVDIYDIKDGYRIASMTFTGQGERVQMNNAYGQDHWSFGPLDTSTVAHVRILHRRGQGRWIPSKVVGPLAMVKLPEPDFPKMFLQSTVISEDAEDASHDDCTVTFLQYS